MICIKLWDKIYGIDKNGYCNVKCKITISLKSTDKTIFNINIVTVRMIIA